LTPGCEARIETLELLPGETPVSAAELFKENCMNKKAKKTPKKASKKANKAV